jgi:hypothetical protein
MSEYVHICLKRRAKPLPHHKNKHPANNDVAGCLFYTVVDIHITELFIA